MKRSKKYKALGCHVYAGGHALGVKRSGRFDTLAHLEEGDFGVATAKKNLGVEVRVGMDQWRANLFARDGVDWLYTNPPCAAWSSAGTRKGAKHDLARHTERVFDLIPQVKPTFFSWECVTNVLTAGKDFALERARFAMKHGYDVHFVVLEVADLGLPSMRKRFFFVASKIGIAFEKPNEKRVTVREAWASLPKDRGPGASCSPIEKELLKAMPVGRYNGSLRNFVDNDLRAFAQGHNRFKKKIHPAFSQKRLRLDEPSYTVMGGAHLWHPTQARRITVLEQQVLAGYPASYEFLGSIQSRYAQIGKAVTPTAGRWLADQVAGALDAEGEAPSSRRHARNRTFQVHDFTNGKFAELYAGVTP